MLYIKNLEDGVELFKALGSDVRINIIKLLLRNKEMNMNEIASSLNITNGALTSHIKKMEDVGLIKVTGDAVGHGNQKMCSVRQERILVDIVPEESSDVGVYEAEIPVGQYSSYNVYPTCGISTTKNLIGEVDDPRYFAHPDRINASVLWFTKGYVEYLVPNVLPAMQKIDEITFSMEISSEAPGVNNDWPSDITFSLNDVPIGMWTSPGDFGDVHGLFTPDWWFAPGVNNDWPSDITFSLNDVPIGMWTSPGDFGDVHGLFTPDWWFANWNQYGLLKMLVINRKGTFIDGLKISDVSLEQFDLDYKSPIRFRMEVRDDAYGLLKMLVINRKGTFIDGLKISDVSLEQFDLDYKSPIRFRMEVRDDAAHVGGMTLFGHGFGNYSQGIRVRMRYSDMEKEGLVSTEGKLCK